MASGKKTAFADVKEATINTGEATATVSGKLLTEDNLPVNGADVTATLKTALTEINATATTDAGGGFDAVFANLKLEPGSYRVDLQFPSNAEKKLEGASAKTSVNVKPSAVTDQTDKDTDLNKGKSGGKGTPAPATSECEPCTDLISTAKRVLRDPKANAAVSKYLLGVAGNTNPTNPMSEALTTIANAIAGKDAVEATGEGCRAQARIEIWIFDAILNKLRKLERQQLKEIDIWLLEKGDLAAAARIYENDGIFFPSVAASAGKAEAQQAAANESDDEGITVGILFPQELAQGEVSPTYLTSNPGSLDFDNVFVRGPRQNKQGGSEGGSAGQGNYSRTPSADSSSVNAPPDFVPQEWGKGKTVQQSNQFEMKIKRGMLTLAKFLIVPRAAHVRVFSCVEGDPCCLQGSCIGEDCQCSSGTCSTDGAAKSKQYVSKVSVTASTDGRFVTCGKTSDSGCVTFKLSPGWYQFSVPEEIKIAGCNYTLCSSSPISAYLGASQLCSDLFFSYKKKGTVIEVISEIDYPDPGNPYERAQNNFPGMQYLLLREGDPSFAQHQTTKDGSVVRFDSVPVGTYFLFCQGPAAGYNSQPVEPAFPEGGRMALRVFGGQAHSKIPVSVKFRTSTTAPATLEGYVFDDTGTPDPNQIVQVTNQAGRVIAAGLTNKEGLFTIQAYKAENVTLIAGTKQIAVTKSQIQAAMKTGLAALPSPRQSMFEAVEATELPELTR